MAANIVQDAHLTRLHGHVQEMQIDQSQDRSTLGAMSFVNPDPFTTRPEITGTFGVIATTHWLATAVGMGVLERGGNAFDAGVATAFMLQIVEPHLNGPGGDVPIMVHDVRRGKTEVICGQGVAPAGLTIAYCKSLGLDLVPGTGLLAPCVPGTDHSSAPPSPPPSAVLASPMLRSPAPASPGGPACGGAGRTASPGSLMPRPAR